MADLLFGLPCVRQRRARIYRYSDSILIYSNQKLRTRYRFDRASIEYNTNLIEADLQRRMYCYYALKPIDQVSCSTTILCEWWLTGSCRRYNWSRQVHRFTGSPSGSQQSWCLLTGNCIMGYQLSFCETI